MTKREREIEMVAIVFAWCWENDIPFHTADVNVFGCDVCSYFKTLNAHEWQVYGRAKLKATVEFRISRLEE